MHKKNTLSIDTDEANETPEVYTYDEPVVEEQKAPDSSESEEETFKAAPTE